MKPVNGFNPEKMSGAFEALPAGAYVAKISAVKIEGNDPFQNLILRVDIVEGEYTGYYTKRFKAQSEAKNSQYEVRYKGDFRITLPADGQQYQRSNLNRFNDAIWKIQKSNEGYVFDGEHEQTLVGKLVGINVRNASFNGRSYTEIGQLETVQDVRDGKCRQLKERVRNDQPAEEAPVFTPAEDVEIPF